MTARELLGIATKIDEMRKLERQVRRLNELACNVELTERQENRREKLENDYASLAASFGLFAETQRDPRGPALKLHDRPEDMQSSSGVAL